MSDPTSSSSGAANTPGTQPLFIRPARQGMNGVSAEARRGEGTDMIPAPQSAPAVQSKAKPPAPPTPPRPVPAARMRKRHWGLLLSFLLHVVAPVTLTAGYLWGVAVDQYSSVTGFIVRQDEGQQTSELLGGIAVLAGGGTASDSDILYEYIRSQAMVRAVREDVDLVSHYGAQYPADPVFALWPDPTIEDLEEYWQRIVRVNYDRSSGLVEVRVLAFDPDVAQMIATSILARSQDLVNELNAQAREDAMQFARRELDRATAELTEARSALTAFRTRTQIVDPEADIQGRMGVMNNLQQQLAQALIDLDLLAENTSSTDPRLVQGQRRIEVIRDRLARERENVATGGDDLLEGRDYPSIIADFEALVAEREYAERTYQVSLAALDLARDKVARQSRYLATYIAPTRAESSEFPKRVTIFGLVAGFVLLSWAVTILIYYSIRDRG